MTHPLDGLLKTIKAGRYTENEELSQMEDLDITQNVRRALLADMLANGKLPQAGSDEANFLMTLLSSIDKQKIDKEKNDLESKKVNIGETIREIMLANPGRLGSAQELAKRMGGTPDETIVDVPIDKSKLEGFTFNEGELSSESHGLTIADIPAIVADYQKRLVEKSSSGNSNEEKENQDT